MLSLHLIITFSFKNIMESYQYVVQTKVITIYPKFFFLNSVQIHNYMYYIISEIFIHVTH